MLDMIRNMFGREKHSGEEQQWVKSLEALLSADDPKSMQRWLNKHAEELDQAFIAALSDVSERLLRQTTIDSTQELFRLHLLVMQITRQESNESRAFFLMNILKTLEEDGVGPMSVLSKTAADVHKRVVNYRGCRLAERGEYTAAIKHFDVTLEIDPSFAPAYCNRARAWLELNQVDRAWAECEALRTVDPGYSVGQATCQLVETLRRLKASRPGTVAEIAEEHGLLEFLRRYDRPPRPGERTQAMFRPTNPLKSAEVPQEGVTPEDLNHIGVVRGRSGDYEGAIEAFNQAMEMNPDYGEARYNRGKAYLLAGKHEKAIADFSAVIEQTPDDVSAYHLRAQAYRAVGNDAAAKADEARARGG